MVRCDSITDGSPDHYFRRNPETESPELAMKPG